MNRSNAEHIGFAILMQCPVLWIAIYLGSPLLVWSSTLPAIFFFLGREHAQREYKLGNPSTLPPWAGFDFWRWKRDAILDLVCPVLVVLFIAALAEYVLKLQGGIHG